MTLTQEYDADGERLRIRASFQSEFLLEMVRHVLRRGCDAAFIQRYPGKTLPASFLLLSEEVSYDT